MTLIGLVEGCAMNRHARKPVQRAPEEVQKVAFSIGKPGRRDIIYKIQRKRYEAWQRLI